MFKKYLIGFLLVWVLLVAVSFELLYRSSSDAREAYAYLMSYSDQIKKDRGQESSNPAQQVRQEVSKQILYKKGQDRLETRLKSHTSELVYSKKEGEFVEHFKDLHCVMQDELINSPKSESEETFSKEMPQQMVRQLKAQEAVYSYHSGKLEAQEVIVAHFHLPGHHCPSSLDDFQPLFQGKAYRSQLSLFKEPAMQAQGFQAIFHDWENH